MTCSLTDTKLNAWCEKLCGINQSTVTLSDGEVCRVRTLGEPWNPCTDRNQAQLVVEAMVNGKRKYHFADACWLKTKEPNSAEGIVDRAILQALLLSPRQICEAAWEAMNGK